MKIYLQIIFIVIPIITSFGQEKKRLTTNFGEISEQESAMKIYAKDTFASAVVLYEKGKYSFAVIDKRVQLIKYVHRRIKVFNSKKYEGLEVVIPLYKSDNTNEKLIEIKAATYNEKYVTNVKPSEIYQVDVSENWDQQKFTFPNVKDGSIIEYMYKVTSPYILKLDDWIFQEEIPKIYSEFVSVIPGNYVYNKSLIGPKGFDLRESSIEKLCFNVGYASPGDCEKDVFVMYYVPAYKEESYMLASSNYLSRITYEIKEYTDFDGLKKEYTKEWKDVDKEFKKDKDIGRQLKNKSFFKNTIPPELFEIINDTERAEAIYTYIKEHYNWNGRYNIFSGVRVKEAYKNKIGNIAEINISLINALQAANLKSELVLASTRENGLISSLYPILTDYNYIMASVEINGENILLDASDPLIPFGMLPFRALNVKARIMDFNTASYWKEIVPNPKNINYIKANLSINNEKEITGDVSEVNSGYRAYNIRKKNQKTNDYETVNLTYGGDFEIQNKDIINQDDVELPLKQNYQVVLTPDTVDDVIYFYPFFLNDTFLKNPFEEEDRIYPIDFGYPISDSYSLTLDLSDKYTIKELPENKSFKLIDSDAVFTSSYRFNNGKLECRFNMKIKSYQYNASDYAVLKTFFEKYISNSYNMPIKIYQLN